MTIPQSTTFGITNCRDMLRKLEREISRICNSTRREDIADHCVNAAWTAWHLADWVWADIVVDDINLKVRLAREAGIRVPEFKLGQFKLLMSSEHRCPELAHCRIITTDSKHLGHTSRSADPEFSVTASAAQSPPAGVSDLDWLPIVHEASPSDWVFKIVEGDNKDAVVDLFQKVRDYWAGFMENPG